MGSPPIVPRVRIELTTRGYSVDANEPSCSGVMQSELERDAAIVHNGSHEGPATCPATSISTVRDAIVTAIRVASDAGDTPTVEASGAMLTAMGGA